MRIVKPFEEDREYMQLHNSIFDVLMPTMKPTAWKVYCVVMRQTHGWNKSADRISYKQIKLLSGIKSDATISAALSFLVERGLITRAGGRHRNGGKWDTCEVTLNTRIEVAYEPAVYKICSDITSKNEVIPLQNLKTQKTVKTTNTSGEAPRAPEAPNVSATPQPDFTGETMQVDALQHQFEAALRAKAAPAETTIRAWNLPPHLTDVCLSFQRATGVEVTKRDKGKWARGAADLWELRPTAERMAAAVSEAKRRNFTMTHPLAMYETLKAIKPAARRGAIVTVTGADGKAYQVEEC